MNFFMKNIISTHQKLLSSMPKAINRVVHGTMNRIFRIIKIALILLLLTLNHTGFSQDIITLKMCHDSTSMKFPLANQKDKLLQISDLQKQNLQSKYFPTLNFVAKATYQSEVVEITVNFPGANFPVMPKEQYSANIEISQLIYDGGNIKAAKEVQDKNALVNVQKVEVDLYKLLEQINELYFKSLLVQENLGILQLTHETILEQRKILIASVNQGLVLESELDNLNAEILKLEQQIIELQSAKSQLIKALSILTCMDIQENTELVVPSVNPVGNDQNLRPEIQLFANQSDLLDASINLTQKKRMPTLGAFVNAEYGKPGYNFFKDETHGFYMVGAQFQWNIWDWKQTNREKQQLSVQKQIIEDNKEAFDKNLDVSLSEAAIRQQKLEQLIAKDKDIIELQTRISKRSAEQMKNGTKTSADYLRDLNAEKQARINMESRQIQLLQAKIDQQTLLGQPIN